MPVMGGLDSERFTSFHTETRCSALAWALHNPSFATRDIATVICNEASYGLPCALTGFDEFVNAESMYFPL